MNAVNVISGLRIKANHQETLNIKFQFLETFIIFLSFNMTTLNKKFCEQSIKVVIWHDDEIWGNFHAQIPVKFKRFGYRTY